MITWDLTDQVALELPTGGRSEGWHLSEILADMAACEGILEVKYLLESLPQGPVPIRRSPLHIHFGLAWEEYLARQYASQVNFHPGELCVDGIYGSPDGIGWNYGQWSIHEFKTTKKSTSREVTAYLWQLMAYMYMAGLQIGILHVLYLNGNYKPPEMLPKVTGIWCERHELAEHWQRILRHKAGMEARGYRPKPQNHVPSRALLLNF